MSSCASNDYSRSSRVAFLSTAFEQATMHCGVLLFWRLLCVNKTCFYTFDKPTNVLKTLSMFSVFPSVLISYTPIYVFSCFSRTIRSRSCNIKYFIYSDIAPIIYHILFFIILWQKNLTTIITHNIMTFCREHLS